MEHMHDSTIVNAIQAVEEEEELEALVDVLGDEEAQTAAKTHVLPVLISAVQI